MKKSTGILALSATMAVTLSGCMGWTATATVDGGTGWYAGDYAPYYWSNWNGISQPPLIGNGPGSIFPGAPGPGYYPPQYRPNGSPGPGPGNMRPGATPNRPGMPGIVNPPAQPPSVCNGLGSNPGSPQQGGFRGDK